MATRGILLTGGAGAGKTMLGCALAFAFKVRGMRVGVMKPLAPGCDALSGELSSPEAAALLASASSDLPMQLAAPYRYQAASPPPAAAGEQRFAEIVAGYQQVAGPSDIVLVEDAGGLATVIDETHDFADLALTLNLGAVVVLANIDGLMQESIWIAEFARRRSVSIRGFVLNALSREASDTVGETSKAIAAATGMPCVGTVRYKEPVSREIVERLLQ